MDEWYVLLDDANGERISLNAGKSGCQIIHQGELLTAEADQPKDPRWIALRQGLFPAIQSVKLECPRSMVAKLTTNEANLLRPIPNDKRLRFYPAHLETVKSLKIGDHVYVTLTNPSRDVYSVIRYIGSLSFRHGTEFGVELLSKEARGRGTTDGTFGKMKYFECPKNCGMFVSMDKIQPVIDTQIRLTGEQHAHESTRYELAAEQQARGQMQHHLEEEKKAHNLTRSQLAAEQKAHQNTIAQQRMIFDEEKQRLENLLSQRISKEQQDHEITQSQLTSEKEAHEVTRNKLTTKKQDLQDARNELLAEQHAHQETQRQFQDVQNRLASEQQAHQETQKLFLAEQQTHQETKNRFQFTLDEEQHDHERTRTELAEKQHAFEEKQHSLDEAESTLSMLRQSLQKSRIINQECDWIIARNEIEISARKVGIGGWGNVVEGTFRGSVVAVKQIHDLILSRHNRRLFEREMNIASRCRHPCLLQFIGATNDDGSPLFVTELLDTSLRAVLQERALEPDEITTIALDVARALNYLHLRRPDPIIHRDISSANVLLWKHGEMWRAKVSDYGSANFIYFAMTVGPGAPIYSAPEAQTPRQSTKVDVYSFGVLLCEMIIQELPDPSQRYEQVAMVTNQSLRELIRRCLEEDPENRPSMDEIVHVLDRD